MAKDAPADVLVDVVLSVLCIHNIEPVGDRERALRAGLEEYDLEDADLALLAGEGLGDEDEDAAYALMDATSTIDDQAKITP